MSSTVEGVLAYLVLGSIVNSLALQKYLLFPETYFEIENFSDVVREKYFKDK